MKNCDEMVNNLLERRDQYVAEQKRKRMVITRTVTAMCCVCLVALLSFGMWQSGTFEKTPPITTEDSIIIGENDDIDHIELNTTDAQSSETGNANSGNDSSTTANIDVGNYPNNYSPNGSEKTMISSFDVNGMTSASYETPENGKFYSSIPLRDAMNEYGDSVLYRIIIDVFSDKEQLSSDSSQVQDECERLSNNGYIVAYESVFNGESYRYYLTLHATYEELISFNANGNYGYFMFLYDERVETTEESPIEHNGAIQ
ncbi:MAG: hypothetical protein HFI34_09435 [Lachnospiraceae bacterium]|nr:hypothetical protein [Lachnospiraceae bacterium]